MELCINAIHTFNRAVLTESGFKQGNHYQLCLTKLNFQLISILETTTGFFYELLPIWAEFAARANICREIHKTYERVI